MFICWMRASIHTFRLSQNNAANQMPPPSLLSLENESTFGAQTLKQPALQNRGFEMKHKNDQHLCIDVVTARRGEECAPWGQPHILTLQDCNTCQVQNYKLYIHACIRTRISTTIHCTDFEHGLRIGADWTESRALPKPKRYPRRRVPTSISEPDLKSRRRSANSTKPEEATCQPNNGSQRACSEIDPGAPAKAPASISEPVLKSSERSGFPCWADL